jgi:CBS domain-containing protein
MLSRPIDEAHDRVARLSDPTRWWARRCASLRERQIDQLPVVDERRRAVGLLDIQDLLAIRALPVNP